MDTTMPADEAFQGLLRQGVIVRSGEALGFPTYIRVTVGNKEQNDRFLKALEQLLEMKG